MLMRCTPIVAVLVALVSLATAGPRPEAVRQYERGLALKRAGRLEEARVALTAAIKSEPRYMEAHYALAWVYRGLGATDKAIAEFREVIRLAPHSAEAVESARAIERIRLGTSGGPTTGSERIAFASERDGNTDVYVMCLDGTGLQRLTTDPAVDDSPHWSPDGRQLAYVSERDGNREIYVMGADGSGARRVTDSIANDDWPVWSPDGSLLAFESDRGGIRAIWCASPSGLGLRQITHSGVEEWMGSWSPDGRQMAILRTAAGVTRVFVVNADGSGDRQLVVGDVQQGRPVWSADGQHVYFTWGFERNAQVCRATVDGRNLANVTRSPYNDRLCDVSGDGRRLLVTSDRDGDEELYLIEMDTAAVRRLTFNPGSDRHAVFAPGGPWR